MGPGRPARLPQGLARLARPGLALTASAVLAAGAAGCSSSKHSASPATTRAVSPRPSTTAIAGVPTAPASTASTGPATTRSASTGPATTTTRSASTGSASTAAACTLDVSLGSPSGAAGTIYYQLQFVDTGSSECRLDGYPSVAFTNASGHTIGAPAGKLEQATPSTVTLSPHGTATATLAIADAANFPPACGRTSTAGLRVTPPGQSHSFSLSHTDQTCSDSSYVTLHVGAVQASA